MAMTTEGRLVMHEGNLALVLDMDMLKQLNIDEDSKFTVVVEGDSIIITVHDEHRARLRQLMEEMNQQYRETFKQLAE